MRLVDDLKTGLKECLSISTHSLDHRIIASLDHHAVVSTDIYPADPDSSSIQRQCVNLLFHLRSMKTLLTLGACVLASYAIGVGLTAIVLCGI